MYLSSAFLPTSSKCFADINSCIPGLRRVPAVVPQLLQFVVAENKAQSSHGLRGEPRAGVELSGFTANTRNASSVVCFYVVKSDSALATHQQNPWVWWSFHFGHFSFYLCFLIMLQIPLAQLFTTTNLELGHEDLNHIYDPLLPQATPRVPRAPKPRNKTQTFTKEVRGCLLDKFSWRPGIFTLHCYWKFPNGFPQWAPLKLN